MAKQTINLGSAANDGTGDPLRTAFDKANDNFDELYTSVGTIVTDHGGLGGLGDDDHPQYKTVPQTTSTTLDASSVGKHHFVSTGVTVPAATFSVGDVVTIVNSSASDITITEDASVTMYLAGTATTGNRTLAQKGIATVLCTAANTFIIGGAGLT